MLFQKLKIHARWLANDLFFGLGLRRAERLFECSGERILTFHGIDKSPGRKDLNGRFISENELERLLIFLKKHAEIVSLDAFFEPQVFDNQRFRIALTFDDGYQNNLSLALPILEKHDAPAAFFITAAAAAGHEILWPDLLDLASFDTDRPLEIEGVFYKKRGREFVGPDGRTLKNIARRQPRFFKEKMTAALADALDFQQNPLLDDYWRLLETDEIRRLAASPLATVGAHGWLHDNMADLPFELAKTELAASKNFLETTLGQPIRHLAWPDGSYSRPLVEAAARLGFDRQLAVGFRFSEDNADRRLRERLTINPFISIENQLVAIRNGFY